MSCVSGKGATATPKIWIVRGMPPFNFHHFLYSVAVVAGLVPSSCPHTKKVIWLSSPKETLSIFSEEKVGGWMESSYRPSLAHELPFGSSCCKSHKTDSQMRQKFYHWAYLAYFSCLPADVGKQSSRQPNLCLFSRALNHTRQVDIICKMFTLRGFSFSPFGNFFPVFPDVTVQLRLGSSLLF